MAIYHCSIKIIGRSGGRSAAASSAYRSGEKLTDEETGLVYDYTRKIGVIYSEVSLCKNAPRKYQNRETLWNAVHKVEKASNAQLAREIEVALPIEFDEELQKEVMREYVQGFVDEGMCADWAIHDKGDGNPHAHILLTTRPIKENGEWGVKEKKGYALDEKGEKIPIIDESTGKQKVDSRNRKQWKRETIQANDWNDQGKAEQWRQAWAQVCNQYLDKEQQITHKSYKRQGIEQEPTIHEGYAARKIEKAGEVSDRCQINREIHERNQLLTALKAQIAEIAEKLKEYVWDKIAGNAPETPSEDIKAKKEDLPLQRQKTPEKAFISRKEQLKKELEEVTQKYHQAQKEIEWIEEEKDKWWKQTEEYLCKSEEGRRAEVYYEHVESEIWKEYEKSLFKGRFKKSPYYYQIQYVLEEKSWFAERKLAIPSKEELKESEEKFLAEHAQWKEKFDQAIANRNILYEQKGKLEKQIDQLDIQERKGKWYWTRTQTREEKPPITRKERDWGMDR